MFKRWLALLAALFMFIPAAMADPVAMDSADAVELLSGGTFLMEGTDPMYYKDHEKGHWLYVSDTVRVEITRYHSASPLMTWYIADLQCAEGSSMYTLSSNETTGKTNNYPQHIARAGRAVYAQSSDFYTYRVAHDRYPGIILRNGKILHKKTYSKLVNALPNLATMAFYPSGKSQVNEAWEVSAKDYQDKGAETVLAFGPILIREGEQQDVGDDAYNHLEPRCCFGAIGRRHYVGLLVEGRKSHSEGATLAQCAQILMDYGCWDAINLDGGNTSAMLFMGESVMLNELGGVDENDRAIPDVLCLGTY